MSLRLSLSLSIHTNPSLNPNPDPNQEAQRARTNLQQQKLPLMLYTERAHFFRRHRLRGACNLCVYAPPSNAHFYVELAH